MDKMSTVNVAVMPLSGTDTVSSVYCNTASLSVSPWDIRFVFSEIILPVGPEASTKVEMRANVVMSPAHAKALMKAIELNLDFYEKTYGEIKLPNSFVNEATEKAE